MTPDQLKAYVVVMREQGIQAFRLHSETFQAEIHLGPPPLPPGTLPAALPPMGDQDFRKYMFAATEGVEEDEEEEPVAPPAPVKPPVTKRR